MCGNGSVDFEALREQLIEECGTAYASGMWPAVVDLVEVESADDDELLCIAGQLGIDTVSFER